MGGAIGTVPRGCRAPDSADLLGGRSPVRYQRSSPLTRLSCFKVVSDVDSIVPNFSSPVEGGDAAT